MNKRVFTTLMVMSTLIACYQTTERTIKQTIQIPIYQYTTESEAEAGLMQTTPQALNTLGNIYIYNQYLLVNERGRGIHIFDNSNTSSPQKVSFMAIPGNYDMAIRNNVLFADSYDDLLSLNINDIQNIQLIERKNNIFPTKHPSRHGIIVGYKDTVFISTYSHNDNSNIFINDDGFSTLEASSNQNFAFNPVSNVGTGGSFSRFTLAKDHLYTVDEANLSAFSINSNGSLIKVKSELINRVTTVETIFPYKDNLFIGSTNGVFIYDISNPANFSYISQFTHARACDPVYVEDDVAFITLRSTNDNFCFGINNQLDILDVANLSQPKLINTYSMLSPHGVGVDGDVLFVCEGDGGLKIFNFTKDVVNNQLTHVNLTQIKHETSIFAYDVIPNNGNLIVVGNNEFSQYDYSNPNNIILKSTIK